MTIRHLKVFIMVADYGSVTAAAEALYISQPTVSQAISELESYYGVKLFDRLSRRLYITETGKQLLSYARHITALFDEMEQGFKNLQKGGKLKIGASVTVGTYMLPKFALEFKQSFPDIEIEAVVKNTTDIENLIIKNSIDFGVVEGIVHVPDIVSSTFMEDELVLVCGKNHPLYNKRGISEFDIPKLKFIMREAGSGTRELFESVMASRDIPWQLAWECSIPDGIKNAAINGIGVGVISKRLVEKEIESGQLSIIKIDGIDLKRKFSIIYHKKKYLTEIAKAFIEMCRMSKL